MPAYNVEGYIAQAVDSIVRQTSLPHELIIINDGSTDKTREIISRYEQISFVRVFDKLNEGLGPTRNFGLGMATGDYVYFFDSDDILEENFVKEVSDCIIDAGCPDIVFFAAKSFCDSLSGGHAAADYPRHALGLLQRSEFPMTRLYATGCLYASACMYVSKRALWVDNGLRFKPIIHEDEEILFRLISLAESVLVSEKVYFHRRIRSGSIMTTAKSHKNLEGYKQVLESLIEFFEVSGKTPYFDHRIYRERVAFFFKKVYMMSKSMGEKGLARESLQLMIRARMPSLVMVMLYACVPAPMRAWIKYSYRLLRNMRYALIRVFIGKK